MLANREVIKRVLPGAVRPLRRAPDRRTTARRCWPRCARWRRRHRADPTIVVLTPGVCNSAYFEHAFLARADGRRAGRRPRPPRPRQHRLHADDRRACGASTSSTGASTTTSSIRWRSARDSQLGVAGLLNAYRAGNVVARQRDRHRRRRRQGALRLRPGDHHVLPVARSRSCRTSRPTCCSNPTDRAATCSSISTSWW